jgi:hypothetical protein
MTTLDPALCWYGLRVKTGREIAIWEELNRELGIAAFVPREWRVMRLMGARKGKSPRLIPLMPGYVFAGVASVYDLPARGRIDDCYGPLRVAGEPARLCPRSLRQLQDMRPLNPVERFRRGGLVTVLEGPLAGRRVRLSDFVAGRAHIDIPGVKSTTIPLEHLEAA